MLTSHDGEGQPKDALALIKEQMATLFANFASLHTRLDQMHVENTSQRRPVASRTTHAASFTPSCEASVDEQNEPTPTDEVDNRELQLLYKFFNVAQKKKLDVKLPEPYNGRCDKRVLDQWLFKMEVCLSNTDLVESKKVALASSLLKDTAFLWWQRRVADSKHTPSWDKFRRAIRKAFEPANADFHAQSSLRRLSQTGEANVVPLKIAEFDHCVNYLRQVWLFVCRKSFSEYDPRLVAPTCLYLASKAEESTVQAKLLIIYMKKTRAFPQCSYEVPDILHMEMRLLEALEFYLIIYHPYRSLIQLLQDAGITEMTKVTWSLVNDLYKTDLILMYPPFMIALACIFVASAFQDKDTLAWFEELRVDMHVIKSITMEIFDFYENYSTLSPERLSAALKKLPQRT
ncbi:hypothetical protein L7F22_006960 [Adiantum nelumboides]|nr:hypothetical protein [Adiantum nelumboides]